MLSIHCKIALFFSFFGLSAILKIRNGEHAHYVGLVVAYTWNREKQMFVVLGKEFDMFLDRNSHLFKQIIRVCRYDGFSSGQWEIK